MSTPATQMSSKTLTLPRTWRPFGTRIVGTLAGVMVVVMVIAAWIGFGSSIRAQFTPLQIGTLAFLGVIALGVWFAIMRSRVTATTAGLTVVNGYRRRDFEWAQVVSVSLRRGAPWATMDLSDGTTVSLIGVQGSDGGRAVTAVRELRVIVEKMSRPS
ncbi:MAG TPA: PH domain-containing protein [Marmoricola sp.]